MTVTGSDRQFMERIGRYKAVTHADAATRHLALPLAERLERSWNLYLTYRTSTTRRPRTDNPNAFYERARTLGLYADA